MAQHSHPPRRVAQSPKQNTFFGGAAVLAAGILVVKLIGLFYKIPLLNIIGEQGTADFGNAYNIYAVLLTISTAGLPVAVSKLVSEANALGRQNQVRRTFRLAMALFLTLGVLSFLVMFFCADQLAGLMHDSMAAPGIKALAPAVICVGCLSAFRGYAQGHSDMVPTAVSQVLEALTKLGVGLVLAWYILYLGFGSEFSAAGAIGGGLWALVPAFFKARWGTNETLFTLMMNYIIIGVVKWLQGGPWEKIPRGSQQIEQFASNACLPRVAGVYCGWIVVLALTVFMFLYMKYTKHGYEIAVIGESENTARYAGMNVGWVIMRTMFLSGAIAGVVGFLLVSGANNTLYSGVAAGAGFTAITVAWLAQLNPFAMVGISALLAVLQKGADTLNTQMGIPASLSDVITGVLLFFMLGCEFFINYKLVFRGAEERQKRKEAAK